MIDGVKGFGKITECQSGCYCLSFVRLNVFPLQQTIINVKPTIAIINGNITKRGTGQGQEQCRPSKFA
jgi:hypothetical protein